MIKYNLHVGTRIIYNSQQSRILAIEKACRKNGYITWYACIENESSLLTDTVANSWKQLGFDCIENLHVYNGCRFNWISSRDLHYCIEILK